MAFTDNYIPSRFYKLLENAGAVVSTTQPTDGHFEGRIWFNSSTNVVYVCTDATTPTYTTGSVDTVADGAISNAKLATDVKVGSLASLDTTETGSVVGAINEVDANADSAISSAADNTTNIGTLASLDTTEKGSLVGAVNEVNTNADGNTTNIGTLGDLTTTEQGTIVGAINEVDSNCDSNASDMGTLGSLTTAEQGSLVGAINEVDGHADAKIEAASGFRNARFATVTLNGSTYTPVVFKSATAATVTSNNAGPYDLSGVGDGATFIVDPDGDGDQTATLNAAAGYSESADSPSTDISGGVDNKFGILVDDDASGAQTVELTLLNCDSGANIATEMQTQIQALGGVYASVTVTYNDGASGHYKITSATLGTGSSVVVSRAADHNVTEELKIGDSDSGTETAGTGDCDDITAVTIDELVTLLSGDMSGLTAESDGGKLKVTSDSTGSASTLTIGNGTGHTVLGANYNNATEYYGSVGLGFSDDMDDTDYLVFPALTGTSTTATKALGVTTKTTSGFRLYCETDTATDDVALFIIGTEA